MGAGREIVISRLTRGSFQAVSVPPSQASRNHSKIGLDRSLSFLALLLVVSFFSSMSYQPETDRMAAGIATPLLRNSLARLTARLPPIDWPVTATFSARIPFARSQ